MESPAFKKFGDLLENLFEFDDECDAPSFHDVGMYPVLYHAIENTANQNSGKPLYIHQYSTEPSHPSVQ